MKKALALGALMALSINAIAEVESKTVNKKRTCYSEYGVSAGQEELTVFRSKNVSDIKEVIQENGVKTISISGKGYSIEDDGTETHSNTVNITIERREVVSSDGRVTRRFDKVKGTRVATSGVYSNGTSMVIDDYESVVDIETTEHGNQKVISSWMNNRPLEINENDITINMNPTPSKKVVISQSVNFQDVPFYYEDMELNLEEEKNTSNYSKMICEVEILK